MARTTNDTGNGYLTTDIDLKHLFKSADLSPCTKRLLYALAVESTAHIFSRRYMHRYHLSAGGIRSGLQRLHHLGFVSKERGVWEIQPRSLQLWLKSVRLDGPERAAGLRFASLGGWDWAWKRERDTDRTRSTR